MAAIRIQTTIFEDAEAWLRENASDFASDGVCAVRPRGIFNPDGITRYYDIEEPDLPDKQADMADHIAALQKMCDMVGVNLFVGGVTSAKELADPCNWDAEVVDAYWQLIFYGEVIYG